MRGKNFIVLLMCICCSQLIKGQSCSKWGPYIRTAGMRGDADVMMADVMIPDSGNAPYTYTCAVQFGIGKSGGYCGLQNNNGEDEQDRPLNNIFSVWDFPNKIQIGCSFKAPMTFVGGFGHEGTGLHSHCDFGWHPNQWYTNVVRRWYSGGNKTEVGYFIYDQELHRWAHYVTFSVPEADAKLHGDMASFLENFADAAKHTRTSCYRAYWKLTSTGQWVKPDSLNAAAGEGYWNVVPLGKDGLQLIACGKEFIKKGPVSFPVNSTEDRPAIILPARIYDLGAYYLKEDKKIMVDWALDASTDPQLSYEVALFDNKGLTGKPLAVTDGANPDTRMIALEVKELHLSQQNYYIRLTIKDIFNQESMPKTFTLEELHP